MDKEDLDIDILPAFNQQQGSSWINEENKKVRSIPDLTVLQASFCVNFEVEIFDWFTKNQIESHLNGMMTKDKDINTLFLVTDRYNENIKDRLGDALENEDCDKLYVQLITFESYVETLKNIINNSLDKAI